MRFTDVYNIDNIINIKEQNGKLIGKIWPSINKDFKSMYDENKLKNVQIMKKFWNSEFLQETLFTTNEMRIELQILED